MDIVVQLGPRDGAAPKVVYRWDPDTEILSAHLHPAPAAGGGSGSVEIEGADGSWLILDIADGQINGLEIVVWPEVHNKASFVAPTRIDERVLRLPQDGADGGVSSLEVETSMAAESDVQERNFHFRFGAHRESTAVRVAGDLLLDVDAKNHVAGLWLLNVPPFSREP